MSKEGNNTTSEMIIILSVIAFAILMRDVSTDKVSVTSIMMAVLAACLCIYKVITAFRQNS